MAGTKSYSASEVTIYLSGVLVRGGFADGEFLRIEQEADDWTDVIGTDGEVTRSKTNDRRATATILLMQSSDDNDLLSQLSNLDRNTPGGAGVGSFLVRDQNGRAKYNAAACWISKPPDVSFGREAAAREWTIRIARLERFDGGNIAIGV
jgi:hypothetical protein